MGVNPSSRARAAVAALASAALIGGVLFAASPARADTAPDPGVPLTMTADALPTVQINGVVWSQAIVGNTVYVGGEFTTAQPAGAAAGVNTVPRSNVLAYNLQTGQLISSWAPNVNGAVKSVVASPDGSRVYIGGNFTAVNGSNRYRIAAFNTSDGSLVTPFNPGTNARVTALAVNGSTLYVAGIFGSAGGQARTGLAAFSTSTGALLPWAPTTAGGSPQAITVSPDGTKVVTGGSFTSLNGSSSPGYGLGMVDAVTGVSLPLSVNNVIRNGGTQAAILSLKADEKGFYGSGYVFGTGGNLEGVFSASWDGALTWVADCHGDTYDVAPTKDVIYSTGHPHFCGNFEGGFPQTEPWTFYRAVAMTRDATNIVKRNSTGNYYNFEGNPGPTLLNWYPEINTGTFTGQSQGGWTITSNEQYLLIGGEFTIVNNKRQQGLVRFATKDIAPNTQGPRLSGADFLPIATSVAEGLVRLSWTANFDRDNEALTYQVFRDGNMTTPIHEFVGRSKVWDRPTFSYLDSGLAVGSEHTYRLRVSDPFGNVRTGDWVTVTASSTTPISEYALSALKDDATAYWSMNESSGATVADWAGSNGGTAGSGVSRGVAGALVGDGGAAIDVNGTSNGRVATTVQYQGPNTFSIETWFKSSSNQGGKIVGFGNSRTGNSGSYDRHVYLDNAGRVFFGVYPGSVQTLNSAPGFNDGKWHHVVAALSKTGMQLYIDGVLAGSRADVTSAESYAGYWKIGGDSLGAWPNRPSRDNFTGSIDEVAIYPRALSAQEVADHHQIGATGIAPGDAPVAAFTSAVADLGVTVDGSGSTDADGSVVEWNWAWGDGATGSGANASHAYAAAGTYDVILTVTDDDGRTGSLTSPVVVTEPPANKAPTAAFSTDVTGLNAAFDASGSSDTDGSIASYAWDFGDGTSASGVSTAHTYGQAGEYVVTLTVTDDDGAAATSSATVSVAPVVVPVSFGADSFERAVSSGLGSADIGGAWTASGANYSVAQGSARLRAQSAGATVNATLPGASSASTDAKVSFSLQESASGSGVYVSLVGRTVGSDDYRARVKILSTGVVQLQLMRGATTLRALNVPDLTYATGETLIVRLQVTGTSPTTLNGKVWKAGTSEPAGWQATVTDSTAALQSAGGIGLAVYLGGTATIAPLTVRFDDLDARPVG